MKRRSCVCVCVCVCVRRPRVSSRNLNLFDREARMNQNNYINNNEMNPYMFEGIDSYIVVAKTE